MAFNKEKILQSAQELIGKGKLAEAIREYQRILSQDPRDQNALNIIGDLYSRMNNTTEAVKYYTKLADVYVKEGFLVRGIAMFKKISKLDPRDTNAMERLADLYTMQGLLSEARAQYLQLAEMYLKGNQTPQALQVMQKVLDLDPENLKIQERLANLYERHGQPVEAAKIFQRMAERLLADDNVADSLQRLEKAVALAPDHPAVRLTQARALQKSGRSQEALAALEKIANLEEKPDALELLLTLRLEAGQTDAASELAERIFAADPHRAGGMMQLARHAARSGDEARTLDVLGRAGEAAIQHDPFNTLETLREIADALPNSSPALEWLARAAREVGDQPSLVSALARQARAAAAAKDWARAKTLYDEAVTLDPNNLELSHELRQVREALGEAVAVSETPGEAPPAFLEQLEAPPAVVELDEEGQAYFNATVTDIDLFSSYGMTDKALELATQLVARLPQHPTANEKLLDLYIASGNNAGVAEVAARLEKLYRDAGNYQRAEELNRMAQQYGGVVAAAEAAAPALGEPAAVAAAPEPAPATEEIDLSAEWMAAATEQGLVASEAVEAAPEPPAVEEAVPVEEAPPAPVFSPKEATEEIEFYLNQGMFDMARDVLGRYEQDFPGEPALSELRRRVEAAAAAPPVVEAVPEPAPEPVPEPEPVVEAVPEPEPVAAGEAEEGESYELVLEEQPKAEPAPATAGMTAESFFSDLAGEIDAALAGAPAAPAPAAKTTAPPPPKAKAPAPPAAAPSLGVLAEVFDEFKADMGEVEEVEDIETHYNLGIAYKEMGLLDEAISEFQKASKAAEKQHAHSNFFQCCILLGHCFMEKGHPQIAARWYERALKTPGLDDEGATALRYDLGNALEQAGDRKGALNCFLEVYGSNVDYRDVGERIRELQGA
ncbi:MAG TPA: tetratricopeptide repeat protein [Candidatus Xenobia bacterium]|nr:tetratricopeptide repeat protein [Candidatus Xenobia bacterium]